MTHYTGTPEQVCKRKLHFPTKDLIKTYIKKYRPDKFYYDCKHCNGYHLTSAVPEALRKARRKNVTHKSLLF